MKKRLCIILLKAATKIIIRIRAEKRLKAIKKKTLRREDLNQRRLQKISVRRLEKSSKCNTGKR